MTAVVCGSCGVTMGRYSASAPQWTGTFTCGPCDARPGLASGVFEAPAYGGSLIIDLGHDFAVADDEQGAADRQAWDDARGYAEQEAWRADHDVDDDHPDA